MVESRLRHFVLKLEVVENLGLAHPFTKAFEKTVHCKSDHEAMEAGRGIFYDDKAKDPNGKTEDLNEGEEPYKTVHTTTFYIGLHVPRASAGEQGDAGKNRKLDITWPTSEFTKICKSWELYDQETMGICVKYLKRFAPSFLMLTCLVDVFQTMFMRKANSDHQKRKRSQLRQTMQTVLLDRIIKVMLWLHLTITLLRRGGAVGKTIPTMPKAKSGM